MSERPKDASEPRVQITKHARDRLKQRGITESQVVQALRKPSSRSKLSDEEDKWVFRYQSKGRTLEVIVYWRGNRFKVKTAYYS